MRTPEFNAYVAPARLYPQLWRLVLGVFLILFIYLGFLSLVMGGILAYAKPPGFLVWMRDFQQPAKPLPAMVMLFTFVGLALGPIIAAPACQYRSPATLFGPWSETWRSFAITVVVSALFLGPFIAASLWFSPATPNLPFAQWLGYLPVVIPLLLIQTGAEELVFRAYLPQQLAARFRSRLIWMGLPAVLFAAGHWNPALGQSSWLLIGSTLVFALIATDLVERTGSIGAAIGLHFVNNSFAILLVSTQGTITGLSLFTSPMPPPGSGEMALMLGLDVVALLVLWRILRAVLDR